MNIIPVKLFIPKGMIYLYDRKTHKIDIPEYSPGHVVQSTETALSIAVQSDLDGEVKVELLPLDKLDGDKKTQIFSGTITCSGGFVSLCLMGDEEFLSMTAKPGCCKVAVTASSHQFPNDVSVYVQQME